MLYIADGTGDADPYIYQKQMRQSFCSQMGREFKEAHYYHGPPMWDHTLPRFMWVDRSMLYSETHTIADHIYTQIKNNNKRGKQPLF